LQYFLPADPLKKKKKNKTRYIKTVLNETALSLLSPERINDHLELVEKVQNISPTATKVVGWERKNSGRFLPISYLLMVMNNSSRISIKSNSWEMSTGFLCLPSG